MRFGGHSRRSFLASALAAGFADQGPKEPPVPSEVSRYQDPITDLDVYRLTDPLHTCLLPAYYSHAITRNSSGLLYSSDRSGTPQIYFMDLKTGDSRQLTEAAADLDTTSPTFTPDSRSVAYFAGRTLFLINLSSHRERELYRIPEGWERSPGFSIGPDGNQATFAEKRGDTSRLRMVPLGQGAARTVLEGAFPILHPIHRPMRAQIFYRQGESSLWLVDSDGRRNHALKIAPGRCLSPNWSAGGRTILYLNFPENSTQLHAIRELTPDSGTDKLVASTSQFASVAFNRDTSVFAGASANRGSPTVLILLRVTRRELTLCEHKASHPEDVTLMFSPDSQRIYFQSDREGKPAIYDLHTERLVERTESE
jgi:oligogalacturonide lyase